jgi:hypothetical protein
MSSPERHLDLDALADVLSGEVSLAGEEHLAGCVQCRTALDDLRAAAAQVTAELAALPAIALPDDIPDRLHDALGTDSTGRDDPAGPDPTAAVPTGSATVTPFPAATPRPATRWLPAAAAAVVLLAGAGYGLSRLGDDTGTSTAASSDAGAEAAGPPLDLTRNSSGADYTDRASLSAAVGDLLEGRRQAQDSAGAPAAPAPTPTEQGAKALAAPEADPLARLRANTALADCLLALLPPDDPAVQPLALDYASFRGTPAMVVVLPGAAANKLDVFVVGPDCSQANDNVLFYTSVDRP